MTIKYLSVCSGIEAASVAWHGLGWEPVAFSEIEAFPSAVLAHHYPAVPNLGDFTAIDTAALGRVDVLVGGTPCQAFSVAGARRSLADERGNLSLAFVELAHALATGNGLHTVVWENVPGVLSTKDNAFGCFLGGLVGADTALPQPDGKRWPNAGMVAGPKGRAAWRVLDAQYFGVAQRRRRVFVVADLGNGADPATVLLEPAGLRRDPPSRGEAGEGVAPTISARTRGGGGLGTDFDLDGGLVHAIQERAVSENLENGPQGKGYQPDIAYTLEARNKVQAVAFAPEIARCDATREGSSQDYETTTMVAQCVTGDVTHTFKAEGFDASEDGTGRGQPIVASPCIAFTAKDHGGDAANDIAPTLRAGGHGKSHANAGVMPAVAFNTRQDPIHGTIAQPLGAKDNGNGVAVASAVRRLTPRECERLQGFPDDYTRIPWRKKEPEDCPDGPRYKAIGNSMAVPCMSWLGQRIAFSLMTAANDNSAQEASDAA